ncbi:glycosyltransferase [Sphingomonas sp.]|uniref:glycosyltransferase n=1 Tax=Sphingomonas sp. TaxID=28214 RepID=UPI002B795F35|nr:glycosyltransferase [Sphingomonas sp.]HTG39249.1 glycosyltransferase [Sphingomonas sp.]
MLRVLTLSSLFPDETRPNFGVFVERQTLGLAALPDTEVRVVVPIGLPPFPLSRSPHYAALSRLPVREIWKGLAMRRPRFLNLPATGGRFHPAMLERALVPVLTAIRRDFTFNVIDASFFFPDGVAAVALGRRFDVPVSIKARGADIHHWGHAPATAAGVLAAGRAADGLLAVSSAMRDDMIAIGMSADRIRVHHTGVDQTRFAPDDQARQRIGISGPLVVSVGALIPRKGHDLVIEAVARIPDVSLQIAGEGPGRARLQAQIDGLGVSDRVRLLGSVAHHELPSLLAAADVMALASASEGLANAWVESLASGTPVVIPDAGGAREVVDRAEAGRIVERSVDGIAAGILEMLAAAPNRQAVRAAARRFTWERNALTLRQHLASLVG